MSARDELAGMVYLSGYEDVTSPRIQPLVERSQWEIDSHYAAADAILAAGYSKPRTISTAEELDALPCGSIVLDPSEWLFRKQLDARYVAAGSSGLYSAAVIDLPATVLYTPKES